MSVVDTVGKARLDGMARLNADELVRSFFATGVVMVQASHYYLKYDSDRLIIRWTLALGLACTGGNSITWPYWIYNVAVKRFGDPSGLETIPFSFPAALVFVGFNASFVHVFYAWRMKVIGGSALSSWILPVVVCVCSMVQLLTMIITAHNLIKHPEVTYLPKIFTACYIWAESAISSDTLITFGMMYLLIWRTRDAGVNESAKLTFRKIVLLSVQNNVLSLILQIFLTVMLTRGPGYWYSVVDATMCPAYTGSLLFALNSRSTIRSNAFSGERTAWPTLPRSKMSGALDAQPTIHDLRV
ncbi:hypothetical protein T439DRAFT_353714 [Meredithblackwellia eburnea MCA 4105]